MKKFQVSVILAAFCICQSADSQTRSDIHVLQATYGAGTQQMDVTAKVHSLVQSGQPNIHVRSQLFGKDPSFGKVKTLTILFTSNGVQYRTDLREGELLSFSNAHPVSATATPAAPTVQPALLEVAAPENHHLAPEGTLYLLKYFTVKNGSGVVGILPGTRLKLLKDLGETMQVKTVDEYKTEFEVDTNKLTNDIDLAAWAKKNDEKSQEALDDYMNQKRKKYPGRTGEAESPLC